MLLALILRLSWICFLLFSSSAGYPAPKEGQTSQNTPGLDSGSVPYGGAVASLVSAAGPAYGSTFPATSGAASGPVYAAAGNLQSEGSRPLVNVQYEPSVSYQQPSSSTGSQSPPSVGASSASAASSPSYGNVNMGSGGAASGPVYGAAPAYPAAGYMGYGYGAYIGAPAASSSAGSYGAGSYGAPGASSSAGSYGAPGASSSAGSYGAPGASSSAGSYGAPGASSSAGSYGAPGASSSAGSYGAPGASSSAGSYGVPGLPWSVQPAGGADGSFSDPSTWMPSRGFPDFNVWDSSAGDSSAGMPQSMSETSPLPPSSYIIQSRNGYQRARQFLSHTNYSPEYPEPPVFAAETVKAPRVSPPVAGSKGGQKV